METMHKYYVIQKGINGKLFNVFFADNKREANGIVNDYIDLGYQITVVSGSVLFTSDNLDEERKMLGITKRI